MNCPICHKSVGSYQQEGAFPGLMITVSYPLYQYSYPGELNYLPPRCLACYDKVEKRRALLQLKKGENK